MVVELRGAAGYASVHCIFMPSFLVDLGYEEALVVVTVGRILCFWKLEILVVGV